LKKLNLISLTLLLFSCATSKADYSLSSGQDVIRDKLRSIIPTFRKCYESGISSTQNVKFNTLFVINEVGHVASLRISKNNIDKETLRCIRTHVMLLKFPRPIGSRTVEVKQPFHFYPVPN
jgi:hypothetical protein